MDEVAVLYRLLPTRLINLLKRLENESMSNRERVKLINKLCKTCSRSRVIPKSMHIPDYSKSAAQQLYKGGFSDIFQSMYEGHQVAVKIVRTYSGSLDTTISVSVLPLTSSRLPV